jgi:epoxyqueuosine reductase
MSNMALDKWAGERGYKISLAAVGLLETVKDRLKGLKADGEFAPGFFEENLSFFKYLEGSAIRNPTTVILVVIPRPAHTVSFEIDGQSVEAVFPPTYVEYQALFEKVQVDLVTNALGGKISAETLQAPLKSLAAALGLVSYGRNNITYTPECGSYFQLAGYLLEQTPGASADSMGGGASMLGLCSNCRACIKACPMGVISEERFLIHAERCYTLFSESMQQIPESCKPPSPECLIGCMKCQVVCPANKGLLRREKTGISFTAEETEALLGEREIADSPLLEAASEKFGILGLTEGVTVLRRNLRRMPKMRH